MDPRDEPRISIPVQAYVDRELQRAVERIERQFVTVEAARVIAANVVNGQGASTRWNIERIMAGLALVVAVIVWLTR